MPVTVRRRLFLRVLQLVVVSGLLMQVAGLATATATPRQAPISAQPAFAPPTQTLEDLTILSPYTVNFDSLTYRQALQQDAVANTDELHVPTSSPFAIGDEVLVITMRGEDAGKYETAYVSQVQGSPIHKLKLTKPLKHSYDTLNGRVMVQKVPHYGTVTVKSGATLTANRWDISTGIGGVIFFQAETVIVENGGRIDMTGKGYKGGYYNSAGSCSYQGRSYPDTVQPDRVANRGGGGGGCVGSTSASGGAGGGGYGANGQDGMPATTGALPGLGGVPYGEPSLSRLFHGSGGGAFQSNSYYGGDGGGIIVIRAGHIDALGTIQADGVGGFGGGGSGGSIHLSASTLNLGDQHVTARGGIGKTFTVQTNHGNSGAGGVGRIRLDYNELSGTTVPIAYEKIIGSADLEVAFSSRPEMIPGGVLTYQVAVRNLGDGDATDLSLAQTLPDGVSLVYHTAPVAPARNGSVLTWALGDLLPGAEIHFQVELMVAETAVIGSELHSTLTAATTAQEGNPVNNTADAPTTVVSPYEFSVELTPAYATVSLGATVNFTIPISNSGWLVDNYEFSLTGLDPAWFQFSKTSVGLAPGGSDEVELTITPLGCVAEVRTFLLEVESASSGEVKRLTGQLSLVQAPQITLESPEHFTVTASRDALFSWRTTPSTTGTLTLYPAGHPEQAQVYTSPSGSIHTVQLTRLARKTNYEWRAQATSTCGSATSPVRSFKVSNGIVFAEHEPFYTVDRDYNQLVEVEVVNQDVVSHTLTMMIEHPYEDLIVNFIGDGSTDKKITLQPGERYQSTLAVHTQDAKERYYDIVARIIADEGADVPIVDAAVVHVEVLAQVDYEIKQIGVDLETGATTYEVINHGQPITDLDLKAVDPVTREPARVFMKPNITHMRLDTDESITFQVFPLFGPEDVTASAFNGMGGKLFAPMKTPNFNFDLMGTVDDIKRFFNAQAGCEEGKQVYAVTRRNVFVRTKASSWYCTNRPNIVVPFDLPAFINPWTVTDMRLQATLGPGSGEAVKPHTTNFAFNDTPVATLADTVPNGIYQWDVPPESLKEGTGIVQQQVQVNSQHPNPGHYVVASDFELGMALSSVTIYVCASSQEEAERIVDEMLDMEDLPDEVGVDIRAPQDASTASINGDNLINLQAYVTDNKAEYADFYRVEATMEYLNASVGTETITLFDDGNAEAHGDTGVDDRFFNARWAPLASGNINMTVTVYAPNGLSASDTVTFNVEALSDLAVTRVYQEELSLLNNTAEIHAEITNNGLPVHGPITLEFRYFEVDEDTGSPVGAPFHVSTHTVFDGGWGLGQDTFGRGQMVDVVDDQFTPDETGIYYVKVVIDP